MKYNEYYSNDYLNPIGITFRGKEGEPPKEDNKQVILYVDVYLMAPADFLDITYKYSSVNCRQIVFSAYRGFGYRTIGSYAPFGDYGEQEFYNRALYLGAVRDTKLPGGGDYTILEDDPSFYSVDDIPTIISSNPEVTSSMLFIRKYFEVLTQADYEHEFHGLMYRAHDRGMIFGKQNEDLYDIYDKSKWSMPTKRLKGIYPPDNARLIPRFKYFSTPVGKLYHWRTIGEGNNYSGELEVGHDSNIGILAKCENGEVTFNSSQPFVDTSVNFPFNLTPFTIDTSMNSSLAIWFDLNCQRSISFVCTQDVADKWVADANTWIKSVGLDTGIVQLYIDPHIMDIPDWYAEKHGL